MTFNAPSFFVGVGTVLALLTFGFGGGVLVSGILSDNGPREPNKVERRAATEAVPPPITTKPVIPVPREFQASPPSPDPSPKPSESASVPVAQPQSPPPTQQPAPAQQQAQPVTPAAETATPALGPQQPVALVNPNQARDHGDTITQQAKRLSDIQQAKRLADERKNAERRKAERLRQRETRQVQQLQRRAPTGSSSEDDADNDVRGERPFFMLRERREFGGPTLFRFFDQQD